MARLASLLWILLLGIIVLTTVVWITDYFGSSSPGVNKTSVSSVSSSCPTKETAPSFYDSLPTYDTSGFCAHFPKDYSTSFLWRTVANTMVRRPPECHDDDDDDDGCYRLPTSHLRRGVLRHPRAWGRVLETKTQQQWHVWILTGQSHETPRACHTNCNTDNCSNWTQLVQQEVMRLLGGVFDVEWTVLSLASTTAATELLRQQQQQSSVSSNPDLIVHALSRRDMEELALSPSSDDALAWEEERRRGLQDFIRAVLVSLAKQPNPTTQQQPPPALVFLDDYYYDAVTTLEDDDDNNSNNRSNPTTTSSSTRWEKEVNHRVLQQLADYYDVGLVSFPLAAASRLLVPTSTTTTDNDWSQMNNPFVGISSKNENNIRRRRCRLVYSAAGHRALAWTLLYALLDFTNDYCSMMSDQRRAAVPTKRSHLVPARIHYLVEMVPPPPLDEHQSLLTISQAWEAAA
jgi:hypothetical protein